MINLKNKKAVITGATGGIGYSILEKFYSEGATVLGSGTNEEKLSKLKSDFNGMIFKKFDISKHDEIEKFVETVCVELKGCPDILINKGIRTFYSGCLDKTDVVARVENLKFNPNVVFGNSYDYYQTGTCVSESIHEYIVNEELLYTTLYNNGYNLVYDNNHVNILGGLHIVDIKSPVALYKSVIYTLY